MKSIVFIGCVESSYCLLECLLQRKFPVSGVITMKESAINSDFRSLAPLAEEYCIDYICTENVNDEITVEFVKNKNPDLIYCFGWSRLIGKELLEIPLYGVIGFHPAELPYNKGRHPLIWALALGLKKTASTFFVMDEGADTGDIISQKEVIIDYADDAESLYRKVLATAMDQVIEFTDGFLRDSVTRIKQDSKKGNTWRKRGRTDGQIDWRMSVDAIYNLVRALTHPYVGAHFMHGDQEVKVWKCIAEKSSEYMNIEPGKIIKFNTSTDYYIKAYDGVIHIIESDEVDLEEGGYLL